MTLSQSAVSDLLDAFRAGDGVDLIRESVRLVLQELIEVEATEVIGAGPCERSETRTNERNGNRPRLLANQAGDIALTIWARCECGGISAVVVSIATAVPITRCRSTTGATERLARDPCQ